MFYFLCKRCKPQADVTKFNLALHCFQIPILKDAKLNELTIVKIQQPAYLPSIETADSEDCRSHVK